jgi:hypothetical protein
MVQFPQSFTHESALALLNNTRKRVTTAGLSPAIGDPTLTEHLKGIAPAS